MKKKAKKNKTQTNNIKIKLTSKMSYPPPYNKNTYALRKYICTYVCTFYYVSLNI